MAEDVRRSHTSLYIYTNTSLRWLMIKAQFMIKVPIYRHACVFVTVRIHYYTFSTSRCVRSEPPATASRVYVPSFQFAHTRGPPGRLQPEIVNKILKKTELAEPRWKLP